MAEYQTKIILLPPILVNWALKFNLVLLKFVANLLGRVFEKEMELIRILPEQFLDYKNSLCGLHWYGQNDMQFV